MKIWQNAEIETLNIEATAFGLSNPDAPDSEKTQVTNPNTGERGWQMLFGESPASGNDGGNGKVPIYGYIPK